MYSKICIVGDGITALMLSKALIDLDINVSLFSNNFLNQKIDKSRTVAISESNFLYLQKMGLFKNKKNKFWKIKEIKIFNSKLNVSKPIINFKNNNSIFYMIKNKEIYLKIKNKLLKNKLFNNLKYNDKNFFFKNRYDLIINCSGSNKIYKKFFYNKIKKNYDTVSYTTIIKHKKINNNFASQHFTEIGPIAFLPLSKDTTSVVWSIKNKSKKMSTSTFKQKVQYYFSKKQKIISFSKISQFQINLTLLRDYYNENILNFGDSLHTIHPLAGQGLNMIIRDIKVLKIIIENKVKLGLPIDKNISIEFSKNTKHLNFLFVNGIDFIEKYFSINNKIFNKYSDFLLSKINSDSSIKNFFTKIADKGLNY